MIDKKSLSIKEFVEIHNNQLGKVLQKNFKQIINKKNIILKLYKNLKIEYKLPCVVSGFNFGDLTFGVHLKNIEIFNRMEKHEYQDILYDTLRFYCKVNNFAKREYIQAPHVAGGEACVGDFVIPLVLALKDYDYSYFGFLLQDYISSMSYDSDYFYEATHNILHSCDCCDVIIKPHVYKNSKNQYKSYYCDACKEIE